MNGLTTTGERLRRVSTGAVAVGALFLLAPGIAVAQPETGRPDGFRLEEATIEGIHRAIRDGQISCQGLVPDN